MFPCTIPERSDQHVVTFVQFTVQEWRTKTVLVLSTILMSKRCKTEIRRHKKKIKNKSDIPKKIHPNWMTSDNNSDVHVRLLTCSQIGKRAAAHIAANGESCTMCWPGEQSLSENELMLHFLSRCQLRSSTVTAAAAVSWWGTTQEETTYPGKWRKHHFLKLVGPD